MPGRPPLTGDKEEINLDGMEPSAMEEERLPAPPTPLPTPIQADEHFQPDRRTSRMMAEESSKTPPPMDGGEEMDVADLFSGFDHDHPDAMDDVVTGSKDMQSALVGAGTDALAAAEFVDKFFGVQHATTFMEMYGQGSLVAEANHGRRSLNLKGLRAFGLRTHKPNGQPWIFND